MTYEKLHVFSTDSLILLTDSLFALSAFSCM